MTSFLARRPVFACEGLAFLDHLMRGSSGFCERLFRIRRTLEGVRPKCRNFVASELRFHRNWLPERLFERK